MTITRQMRIETHQTFGMKTPWSLCLNRKDRKYHRQFVHKSKMALEKIVHNHEIIYQGPATKLTAHIADVINRVLMLMPAWQHSYFLKSSWSL